MAPSAARTAARIKQIVHMIVQLLKTKAVWEKKNFFTQKYPVHTNSLSPY